MSHRFHAEDPAAGGWFLPTAGGCLLPDGGWKLTSADDISWLSKSSPCQFVARRILRLDWDAAGHRADAAPQAWLDDGDLAAWAWSDEIRRCHPRLALLPARRHDGAVAGGTAATARLTTQGPSPARITLAPTAPSADRGALAAGQSTRPHAARPARQ
jgi:hypothetical protein